MKKKSIYKKNIFAKIFSVISPILFTLVVAVMIINGLNKTEVSSEAEGRRILSDSIFRSTVKCYAIEGRYPESIEYVKKKYGIIVDDSKYVVDYEIFASNIMPLIKVRELRK